MEANNQMTTAFLKGRDYSEIGPFPTMIAKYPCAVPAPAEIATVPAHASMALIYSRANAKWNVHLHDQIVVGDEPAKCIGIVVVQAGKREREAAILIPENPILP